MRRRGTLAVMDSTDPGVVVGFDPAVIDAWLPTVTEVTAPLRWSRLPGGHSNLTYLIVDADGRELVIRRPPRGEPRSAGPA